MAASARSGFTCAHGLPAPIQCPLPAHPHPGVPRRGSQQHPTRPHLWLAAATSGATNSVGSQEPIEADLYGPANDSVYTDPAPSVQQLESAVHDVSAFAAALRHLSALGVACTEAHVVAGWAAQRRSPALRPGVGSREHRVRVLQVLVLLEELTRRQLVALTPDQLGFVFRCYVLAGGASKPLLSGLQQAACSWGPEDYTAAGFAELAWALASCGQPVSEGCRHLLHAALQSPSTTDSSGSSGDERDEEQGRAMQQPGQQAGARADGVEERAQDGAAAPDQQQQPPPQQRQQQQQQRQRDWQGWFECTPASRVVLLLWSATHLGCPPCGACLQAAAAALLQPDSGLQRLPTRTLVTLLWSLATLRAAQQQQLLRAVSQQLGARMEGYLEMPGTHFEGRERGMELPTTTREGSDTSDTPDSTGSSGDSSSAAAVVVAAEDFQPAQLSTVVWACGQLRHGDPRMLSAAATLLQGRVWELTPAETARLLWGLAQLGSCPIELLEAVADNLQEPGVLSGHSVRQLAMVTYAFASLDFFPGQACVDAIADACLAARSAFDPRALSHVLWNMSRLGLVDELFYQAFVPVILPSIEQYGPAELADVARVYSRYALNPQWPLASGPASSSSSSSDDDGSSGGWMEGRGAGEDTASAAGTAGKTGKAGGTTLFDALAAQTVARIEEAEVQDILRIMTAFHQMGLQPEQLVSAVDGWANQRLRRLSPQALSLAIWGFARMGTGSPKLLETAAACAEQQLGAFSPQQMAQVAWSLAKLRWPAPCVLRHAGSQLAERGAEFGDKEASNVLWALASQGERLPEEALDRIAASLQPRLRGFGPQSLSNIAWAYATLGHSPPDPFLRLLGDAAERQLRAFEPQGLSLLVWSLASLGCRHYRLFAAIGTLCQERPGLLRQFEGQNISNLLWGFCRSGFRAQPEFLEELAKEAELRVCDLKPQELFNIAWACSQMGQHSPQLFEAIAGEAAPRAFAFSPQELSGTLWALAKCGHTGRAVPALMHAMEHELAARESTFEDRHLAITLWSFGQLAHVPAGATMVHVSEGLARRLPGMSHRTLVTLLRGVADVEATRWRRQVAAEQRAAREAAGEEAGAAEAVIVDDAAQAAAEEGAAEAAVREEGTAEAAVAEEVGPARAAAEEAVSQLAEAEQGAAQAGAAPDSHAAIAAGQAKAAVGSAPTCGQAEPASPAAAPAGEMGSAVVAAAAGEAVTAGGKSIRKGSACGEEAAAGPLLPAPLVDAMVSRTLHLLPRLQPFELPSLLRCFAALDSRAAADQLLLSPSPAAEAALLSAAQRAALPAVVELLWAMAAWGCFPPRLFGVVAARLCTQVSREYSLSQPALALLGEALAALPPAQRQQIRLRKGLVMTANAAAHVEMLAAAKGPGGGVHRRRRRQTKDGSGSATSSSNASSNGSGGSGWYGGGPAQPRQQHQQQQGQRQAGGRQQPNKAKARTAKGAGQVEDVPKCDNSNEESFLSGTLDDWERIV